ncbi:MAG: AI-2E family transporter [Nanoarchaeota archaeon]
MERYRKYIPRTLLLVLLLALLLISYFIIKPFLLSLFFGVLLGYITYPVYQFIQKRVHHPTIAALFVCLLIFLIILIPVALLFKTLVQESYVVFISVKQKLATGVFQSCYNQFCQQLKQWGKDPLISGEIQEIAKGITNWVVKEGQELLFRAPTLVSSFIVILFTLFYTLKEGKGGIERLVAYLNIHTGKYQLLTARIGEIVRGVVNGYLLIALIQGILGGLGFFLFGLSSPIFWGLVMAFLALIPYLGTWLVWAPAALLLGLEGIFQDSTLLVGKGIGLFLYGVIVVSSIDNFLRPKVVSKTARIHPLVILVGALGGVFSLGAAGVIVGPLVLSLVQVVLEVFLLDEK